MNRSPDPSLPTPALPPPLQAIHARLRRAMPHLHPAPRPDASFFECGGDSLDFVELLCVLESDYGVRLGVDDLAGAETIGDLLALIDRRATKRPESPLASARS